MSKLESIFDRKRRDKMPVYNYQSRILGLFSEEIVKIWVASPYSDYENLGRPTVYVDGSRYTFDFAFQPKHDKKIYIVEMKCWIPFENFKYFVLDGDFLQKARGQKSPFGAFLKLAHGDIKHHRVSVTNNQEKPTRKEIERVSGFILIWGKANLDSVEEIKASTGLSEILGLEDMIQAMIDNEHQPYVALIKNYQDWSNSLFDRLAK